MRIPVSLSIKSINQAVKQLQKAKKDLTNNMLLEFLTECCERIKRLANTYLESSTIGESVKDEIKSGWAKPEITGNKAVLKNTSAKAVFVEFGVGIVGQENPHDNATEAGYRYNVSSASKRAGKNHDENTWRFHVDDESQVDLWHDGDKYYEAWQTNKGGLKIITRGSPATMFVFNAIRDFSEGNYAEEIWNDIKSKYWG